VEEGIESPARDAVEWEVEILEGKDTDPETTTVVTEEVVFERDGFRDWGRTGHGTFENLLAVKVEPRRCWLRKPLDFQITRLINEFAGAYDATALGVQYPI
jgi:hypothetical protein